MRRLRSPAVVVALVLLVAAGVGVLLSSGGGSGGGPTRSGENALTQPHDRPSAGLSLRVTGTRRQRIDGWGASIVDGTVLDPLAVPTGLRPTQLRRLEEALYGEAGVNILRVWGPGFRGFPGGGSDPDGQGRLRADDGRWKVMRRARRRGVKLMFTASNAPVGMKRGRDLARGSERRFGRYIADNLSFADRLGVPFQLAAVGNEVDNYAASFLALRMTPEQAATVYDELAREIRRRGLRTRLAIGDNLNWASTLSYARSALHSPEVRRLTGVIASHAYGASEARADLGALARRYRRPVWMTEYTGANCDPEPCPKVPDIHLSLRWAQQINRDLTSPESSAWFVLRAVDDSSHEPNSGILVRTRGRRSPFYRTKTFYVLRQFTYAARPGARRLVVRGGHSAAVAFVKGRRVALVITNAARAGRARVDLGPRRGRIEIRRTSGRESFSRLPERSYSGRPFTIRLAPTSVTTLVLRSAR